MDARALRITYLHRTQGHGVEGVHIRGIANGLRRLGHEVTVLSPGGSESAAAPRAARPASPAAPSLARRLMSWASRHMPEFVFELAEIGYNLLALRSLSRQRALQGTDLLYERYAIFAAAGAFFARRHGVPLLLEVNYTSRSPLVRQRSPMLLPLARRFDAWIFRQATALVAVSSRLRDELVADFGVPAAKILVVPNAADPEAFNTGITPLAEIAGVPLAGRKVVGFVGSFAPWHGLPLLLEAFRNVVATHHDALLVLVGDGPERGQIERLSAEAGLARQVLFAGSVGHDRLMHCVAAFSLGVMPDSNEYGSPMKIFEYMAMGKPVVVPDYPPLLDVITDGQQGRVFRRKDAQALASCISAYFGDPDRMAAAGRRARESVEREHNWLHNARRSLDFALAARDGRAAASAGANPQGTR